METGKLALKESFNKNRTQGISSCSHTLLGDLQDILTRSFQDLQDVFSLRSPEVLHEGQEAPDSLGLGEVVWLQVFLD